MVFQLNGKDILVKRLKVVIVAEVNYVVQEVLQNEILLLIIFKVKIERWMEYQIGYH